MTTTRVLVAGRIQKRNGQVMMDRVKAPHILGMSQRWGMARFDCDSGRHKPCMMCRLDNL